MIVLICARSLGDGGDVTINAYHDVHEASEPLFFEHGFGVTWRNGKPGHGGGQCHNVTASAFVLVYVRDDDDDGIAGS